MKVVLDKMFSQSTLDSFDEELDRELRKAWPNDGFRGKAHMREVRMEALSKVLMGHPTIGSYVHIYREWVSSRAKKASRKGNKITLFEKGAQPRDVRIGNAFIWRCVKIFNNIKKETEAAVQAVKEPVGEAAVKTEGKDEVGYVPLQDVVDLMVSYGEKSGMDTFFIPNGNVMAHFSNIEYTTFIAAHQELVRRGYIVKRSQFGWIVEKPKKGVSFSEEETKLLAKLLRKLAA